MKATCKQDIAAGVHNGMSVSRRSQDGADIQQCRSLAAYWTRHNLEGEAYMYGRYRWGCITVKARLLLDQVHKSLCLKREQLMAKVCHPL
ncbi:hypothetical protein DL89DRAFT_268185 [Linderina pennispora]|uniref:Uncharacterized protein n=1 Tax=Linderina pennispora TaxID=61395 RepID=A0A1Y1W6J8_9FUNG|nr:uncharacterized protein DL89DRAFT_268185 [Linderina pennispora]ORX69177.1 hypothetical protein DL89DRAFT_268185 [Linderina pennispora]